MWRFKASKFKNAAPKILKKEEWITEISASNLMQTCSNHMAASTAYMAFNTDTGGGGNLGVLPLTTNGRQPSGSIPMIRAHAGNVTDFAFNPFDDLMLATTPDDSTVKIWSLPNPDDEFVLENPRDTITIGDKRIETLCWHPSVDNLITVTMDTTVRVYNIDTSQQIADIPGHNEQIQSCSWRADGSVLVTSARDKQLRVLDPRTNSTSMECEGHANMRDSRVVWLGNKDFILSSAFDQTRSREVILRDVRNLSTPVCQKSYAAASTVLMPLYDADTGILFLAGVGDTSLQYCEVTDTDVVQNSISTIEQVKGLCMVPKRAMDVMACEVDRLLLLGQHAIIPLPIHVPRKVMNDFHADLFPDTPSGKSTLSVDQWFGGDNTLAPTMSLNPKTNSSRSTMVKGAQAGVSQPSQPKPASVTPKPVFNMPDVVPNHPVPSPAPAQPKPEPAKPAEATPPVIMRPAKKHVFAGVRQSKFRHLEGVPLHKSNNIDNIRNLSKSVPGESDMFHANAKFCAVPLGGSGGCIAVLKIDHPCRLPDTGIPAIQNGSMVDDFTWDPFDEHVLVVGCDDAKIRLWRVPDNGLDEGLTTEPEKYLIGHEEKLYFVRYHPLASNVLATGSYDMTVRIWDTETCTERLQLEGHTDTILCFSWSPDGSQCVTACKDGIIRLYDPRTSSEPIKTCTGVVDTHGARAVWACDGKLILIVSFEKSSERSIRVYSPEDLSLLHKECMDTSPATLVPHYDEDSSTLFLTARGEGAVKTYEIVNEPPYVYSLTPYKADGLHQALAFLPKTACDVAKVQFARALRLTQTSVEPLSFTVPRIKTSYFQDDLYPETKVTWEPALSSAEWFDGQNGTARRISLRPTNMELLSEAPVEAPKPKKYESFNAESFKSDEQKKEELLSAMLGKFEVSEEPLPQDLTEGCEEDEWDDY